jgi:polyisoprenoid-binding protein YceI
VKLARVTLAIAAAALLSCRGSLFGGAADAPVRGVWLLVPAESSIWFVGIKNNAVAVPGSFSGLEGGFDTAKREGWVEVRVATLATGDAPRDENLRVHFFDSVGFPVARFTMTGTPSAAELPAVGASLSTTLSGTLLLHGAEHPLAVPVRVTREAEGRIRVRNSKPVVLSMKDLGMEQPLAVLKAVCGHEALSAAVPIDIDVVFAPI